MQNRQSITQRITLINILLVTTGILSAFIIDSWVLHTQTTRQAEKQLDEQIEIIANSLIAPLWSFNHEAIEVFGDAFTANEEVVKLQVYSTGLKEPVYTKRKQNSDDIVSKTADIRYKDEVIGRVNASIALTSYKSVFFNHLLFGTVTTFFVAALVIFGIRYFVKRVLNTPLHTLTSWTNDVAEGKFVGSPNEIHTTELLPVATKFQHMAERIHDREAELRKLSKATEHSPACIIITDHDEQIEYVNAAFEKVTGYSRQEVIGKRSRYLLKSGGFFSAKNRSPMRGKRFWQGEIWNERKDGTPFAVLLTVSSIENTEGKTTNYIGAFSDITQLKEQQRALELIAHYDVLTQLPNRVLFADRFKQAVAHCKRTETMLAVCFIDLDNFKPVNDQHGHKVGDQLLVEVARRINASIREEDTVSRQGGDEFALLLQGLESFIQCEPMLQRLHQNLSEPYYVDGISFTLSASTGVTLYPKDNADLDTLLRHADQAMYQAKLAGRNCYRVFNTEEDQRIIRKQHQLDEIEQAFSKSEFELHYQPKINMRSGRIVGAEALIRWHHPNKGIIYPPAFLPIIEGTPLELEVGEWVIRQALTQLLIWQNDGLTLELSVNISPNHLQSPQFTEQLVKILADNPGVRRSALQLEILESSTLGDLTTTNAILKHCSQKLGVSFALDDFGTGYSSLTRLKTLPADTIKIDQSFVRDMLDDPNDYAIINAVISLADAFQRRVIAEGVETIEQGLMLLGMGCEYAQGYGIAKPMPVSDFAEWMRSYTPEEVWMQQDAKKNASQC